MLSKLALKPTVFGCLSALCVTACAVAVANPQAASSETPAAAAAPAGQSPAALVIPPLQAVKAVPAEEYNAAIKRGVEYLLSSQNADGSWSSHATGRPYEVFAPGYGSPLAFRVASSGLCCAALLKADAANPKVQESAKRCLEYLLTNMPRLARPELITVYNVWGHAYGLRALCMAKRVFKDDKQLCDRLAAEAKNQFSLLAKFADIGGGWSYLDFRSPTARPSGIPTSFTTATVLLAINETQKEFALAFDKNIYRAALKGLLRQRTRFGTYVYSMDHRLRPGKPINGVAGSLARNPACNLAVYEAKDQAVSLKDIEDSLQLLWARGAWLDIARKKPIPHEAPAQNSGYFFYYGYYYASQCLSLMPEQNRKQHAWHLMRVLLPLQEKMGDWWDYPLYNYSRAYGTGYALFSMAQAREIVEAAVDSKKP